MSAAQLGLLQRDLGALSADIDAVREAMYSGDFGDRMQQCTAKYHDAERAVARLKEADGKDSSSTGDATTDALWRQVDNAWSDLIVDASLM